MQVRKILSWVLFVALLLVVSEVKAQTVGPEQADSLLHVVPLYDKDHDGQEEGVGAGVVVSVRESGSDDVFFNVTNEVSSATFGVAKRTYIVQAYPEQTRLFFRWVCAGEVTVTTDERFLILHCTEEFFIFFPWAKS